MSGQQSSEDLSGSPCKLAPSRGWGLEASTPHHVALSIRCLSVLEHSGKLPPVQVIGEKENEREKERE